MLDWRPASAFAPNVAPFPAPLTAPLPDAPVRPARALAGQTPRRGHRGGLTHRQLR
ncbi:hypothetical protein I552_1525 [Mycobacterium xenopi 3993]|nr:hypothetical protein I552_1525 [Mycobacterium xenopi 3993]